MKDKKTSRRTFIATSGKAALAVGLLPSYAQAIAEPNNTLLFTQKLLPYDYKALDKAIDALTMEIHFSKHAATYTKNLNEAYASEIAAKQARQSTIVVAEGIADVSLNEEDSKTPEEKALEDILKNISQYSAKMRNNAGGHFNHEFFWQCMHPKPKKNPEGNFAENCNSSFGSFEKFKSAFADAAKNRFGSGWAWLIVDEKKELKITSTPNQDNPLMDTAEIKGTPLLALDVWEHAYYLRYQNKRADYIEQWWNVVNWHFVEQQYNRFLR